MNQQAFDQFVAALEPAFLNGDAAAAAKREEQDHTTCLQTLYAALRDGDSAALARVLADDVELEITGPASLPLAGHWKGRDQVLKAAARNFGMLEDQKPEVLSLVAQGDTVVVLARERGRVKGTDKEYDVRFVQHYRIKDGAIAQILEFCDNPSAFAAG